ncbi:MAG: hypothetical protein KDJ69_16885 [Nitratireductor sp.]|nr:hypothetical protein [Nitratireductor sp.]
MTKQNPQTNPDIRQRRFHFCGCDLPDDGPLTLDQIVHAEVEGRVSARGRVTILHGPVYREVG